MSESSPIVFPGRDFDPANPEHVDAFLRAIPAPDSPALSMMGGLPTLLDCLRVELAGALRRGRTPIKLLVHGDCVPALMANARDEGELDASASPSRILDLPVMMSMRLISIGEGARIVCEGDDLHQKITALPR